MKEFASKGATAQVEVNEVIASLDDTLRRAMHAAGCKDEAAFKRLPREEQNAFLAEARGLKHLPNRDGVKLYDPETIERSPFNRVIGLDEPETVELIASVKEDGVLQNGIIRPAPADPQRPDIKWQLIAGERRWLAAKANKVQFPAAIRDVGDTEAMELQGTENFQRKSLNPMEEARTYQQLRDAYITEGMNKVDAMARLSTRLKKEKSVIYERLTLLDLPPKAQELVGTGRLPASQASLLTSKKLHDPKTVESLAATIANTPGNAPVPFRESQRLVADAEEREERLAEWQRLRGEYVEKGWKVLTDAENKKVFPHGANHVDPHSLYVLGEAERNFGSGYKSWVKAMGKHAPDPVLARAPNGAPAIVYSAILAEGAVEKNKPRSASAAKDASPAKTAENARAAKKRDGAKARRAAWTQTLQALVAAVERTGDNETFLRAIARLVVQKITSSSDRARQVVDRRGLESSFSRDPKKIVEANVADLFNAKQLRGMIIESIAWHWAPWDFDPARGWQPELVAFCAQWGVDPVAIEKNFHLSGNGAVKPVKAAPPVKKARRTKLSPEGRARIVAAMRAQQQARWLKMKKRK